MRRRLALLSAALGIAAAGCLPRLSDPAFAFRDLGPPDALAGESLVFGTIEIEASLFGPGDAAAVILKRVRPTQEEIHRVASVRLPFRAFRTRQLKDGHFVLALEPGAYELQRIVTEGLLGTELVMDEDSRRAMRFAVSRPAVIDLGVLRVRPADGLATYGVSVLPPPPDPGRTAQLRAAIAGTPWERLETRGAFAR